MKNKLLMFLKKPFIRNVTILTSGTIGAQFINMILSPIITRIYGPEAYGLMGAFQAIVSILAPISALSLQIAIVLPKDDREAKWLVKLALYITTILTFLSLITVMFFNEQLVNIFQLENISNYLYLIPIIIFFAGIYRILEQWLIRKQQFDITAKTNFSEILIRNGSKLLIGFVNPVAGVLIFFTAIQFFIKSILIMFFSKTKVIVESLKEKIPLKKLFYKYKEFPLFRAPEVFINAVSGNIPVLLLTSFFGPEAAGFYSIGRTVLGLPSTLIGKSVGDVFYPRVSNGANNKESVAKMVFKASSILALLGIIPFGLIILFGPQLFGLVFGSGWMKAGEYARWMALWSYIAFMNRPSVMTLPVLSAQKFQLIYTIIMLVVRLTALYIGFTIFKNDLIAIALFSITGALLNIGLILITLMLSKKFDNYNMR